ncbi:hypothetical protein sS8_4276 [Methylocaldum marinum]|uniref:Uncharacterized protein n=1 Tax=Methylocaldum marinum TaxID=1432792 RepID=A0A250KXG2_9GAMM|nr:hypothetical protein [Methylocaldum marinum]BBA36206.1 hypothetical protein sS8_4276 [Methylocaldum marinum]
MNDANAVRDGYESYYTEKLWQLVPEVYRNEDGIAANPGVLRRIVELIGAEAARSRRSIDRLWEDQHIETCDDWAVPYIGDLVGARLVSAQDRRGRRVDVANAVRFRRRRGTPDLLDTLVRAMSGWDVVLVEGFRRLARTRHRLDPVPRAGGFFTGTLPGGTADLRRPAGAEIADGPFDEYFHTLDARLLRGRDGRFGITKLNFHLYRLSAYRMTAVDPVELADPGGEGFPRTFTIDPSGRDIPLFIDADPPDPDAVAALPGPLSRPGCGQPFEWDVTQSMRCRLLGHVAYQLTPSHIEALRQLANPPTPADEQALFRVPEIRFASEQALRRRLQDFGAGIPDNPPDWYRTLVALGLMARTGKARLYPAQVEILAGAPFSTAAVSAANLSSRACHPEPEGNLAELLICPEQGRFARVPPGEPGFDPLVGLYHYGFSGDVGAGPYLRDPIPQDEVPSRVASDGTVPDGGVLQGDGLLIDDNRTYSLSIRADTPIENAVLQAGPQRRPYVLLAEGGANLVPQSGDTRFLIDGGWYGVNDPGNPPAAGAVADFVIEGAAGAGPEEFDFDRIEIRFATFDPGGARADGLRIPALRLLVRARVRKLMIRRSIMGPVHVVRDNPDDPSTVEELLICESIVDARETADRRAVSNPFGTTVIESSTLFGDVSSAVLKASDSIVDGRVSVVNNQAGCFRFSASEPGEGVRMPPRYRDFHAPIPESAFNSTRFGDPQYAQLSIVAPQPLLRGAENGSEMGVFSFLLTPIRLASVRAKVNEFGPVGLLAQYLFEGDYRLPPLVEFGVSNPPPEPGGLIPPPEPGDVIPQPPPPEPPPLPTACPDQASPLRPPSPAIRPVLIDPASLDINGAPAFWRGVDWRPDAFPVAEPEGESPVGIPFDKVRILLEYDARFGTLPAEQGWKPNAEEAAALFKLDGEGALRFEIGNRPAFFTAQAGPEKEPPIQVHAYVGVFPEQISDLPEESLEGFEQRVEANDPGKTFRGMRADWGTSRDRNALHYLSLDGKKILGSPEPSEDRRRVWHELSLQADYREGLTLLSLDGETGQLKLSEFGRSRDSAEHAGLRAVFGFRGKKGHIAGRLRNFVVSAPGRYIRAWMRAEAPAHAPVLRLGFVTRERVSGGVRFRVRYGVAKPDEPVLIPMRLAEATLELDDAEPGREVRLEIPLDAARAKDALVLTLERDSRHREDTLETGIRLVSAALTDGHSG